MTTLFQAPDVDAELDALLEERFIKDGQVDVEEIKKSWKHSQKHIKTLEGDNRTLREDNIRRMSYEDLAERLKAMPNGSNANQNNDGTENDGNRNTQNVDIDALVEAKLTSKLNQFQQSTIESENRAAVIAELRKAWGDNYVARLEAEANELGKSQEQINAMAGSDPKMLLRALGINSQVEKKPIVNTSAPRSSITARMGSKSQSRYDEYKAEMKADPRLRDSPQYQMKMLREAEQMGDAFYQKG